MASAPSAPAASPKPLKEHAHTHRFRATKSYMSLQTMPNLEVIVNPLPQMLESTQSNQQAPNISNVTETPETPETFKATQDHQIPEQGLTRHASTRNGKLRRMPAFANDQVAGPDHGG